VKRGQSRARRQGILPFVYRIGDREAVTARAGLPLVLEAMRALRLDEAAREELPSPKRRRGFAPEQKLEALVMLIAAGGDRIEDIRIIGEDKGLETLLGGALPSPDALLDFLTQFHDPDCLADRPQEKKAFVPAESAGLRALERINRLLVARGADRRTTTATIDHDGTIIEAHKREATYAYDGIRGYQPLVAVWAEEQLIVGDEFRDGNVAGGEDPLSGRRPRGRGGVHARRLAQERRAAALRDDPFHAAAAGPPRGAGAEVPCGGHQPQGDGHGGPGLLALGEGGDHRAR
jgi:hypothetical protein